MSQALLDELKNENLCTHFVLPFLKLNKFSFIASNFVDCYLTKDGHCIAVHVIEKLLLSQKVTQHKYFVGFYRMTKPEKLGFLYLLYRVPPEWHRDINLFREGKYSKMSDKAKDTIRRYSGLPYQEKTDTGVVTDGRLLAFDKHPLLRRMWENFIVDPKNRKLDEEVLLPEELLSVPREESYINLDDLVRIAKSSLY